MASRFERVVIVTRRTELEDLVLRFNTVAQARFYLEHSGSSFAGIQAAHDEYASVLGSVIAALPEDQKHHVIDRDIVPSYLFDHDDLVVTIGQDGLVSNTAKYLRGQPLFAINPEPQRYDGILLPFEPESFAAGLTATLHGEISTQEITLARAVSSNNQELLAFNDFFIGARSHISARYEIAVGGRTENQSSSGIIVSTGAGSTGWLQSVYAGAAGVVAALGGTYVPPPDNGRLSWNADRLVYSVREPFPSQVTGCSMVHGSLTAESPLSVTSRMPTDGVIFSDGMEQDFLEFNSGATLTIAPSDRKALLVAA